MTAINEALEAASIEALMDTMADEVVNPAPTPSQASRKAAHEVAMENLDANIDHMLDMQEKMQNVANQIVGNIIDLKDSGPELSPEALKSIMEELQASKDITNFLKVRYEKMLRPIIFAHITEVLAAKGVAEPQFAPGDAPVPSLGKRFARTGGKAKTTLDFEKFAELLGEERWNQVHITKTIPAREETTLDETALIQLVAKDPEVMEFFKASMRVDSRTNQALNIFNLED